jgi:hypothetical protein
MLDGMARQMVKDRPLKELSLQVENILPNVQCLLESRDDLILLVRTVDVGAISVPCAPHETTLLWCLCQRCIRVLSPTTPVLLERIIWRKPVYIELDMFVR